MYLENEHKGNIIAFTPEVGTREDFFWPQPSRIVPLAQENLLANKLLAYYAGAHFEIIENRHIARLVFSGGTNMVAFPISDLMNLGQETLQNGLISFRTNHENVQIEPAELSLGNLETLEQAELEDLVIKLTINEDLPKNEEIVLIADITSDNALPSQITSSLIVSNTAPSVANLAFPLGEEAIEELDLVLRWRPSSSVEYYNLEVARDENFTDLIVSEQELKSFSYELTDLTDHRKYYWRVKAVNPYTDGEWSNTRYFYINSKLETGAPNELPETLSLQGNFPNPFNPTTTIRVGLEEDSPLRVDVYTTDGRLVQTITDDFKVKGWHDMSFDASNLSSGVYIYRVQTNNDLQVGKMTLIK